MASESDQLIDDSKVLVDDASNTKGVPFVKDTTDAAVVACSRLRHWGDMDWTDQIGWLLTFPLHIFYLLAVYILIIILWAYEVEPREDPYESSQYSVMEKIIRGALLTGKPMDTTIKDHHYTQHNCLNQTGALPAMHYMFLFIWGGVCMTALGDLFGRAMVIINLPGGSAKMSDDDHDRRVSLGRGNKDMGCTHDVDHMNNCSKFVSIVFVLLPAIICQLFAMLCGAKLIIYSPNAVRAAYGAMSLNLVMGLSNTIFSLFAGNNLSKYMGGAKYKIYRKDSNKTKGFNYTWETWGSSAFFVFAGMIFAVFVLHVMYPNVNEFHRLCSSYLEHFLKPGECIGFTKEAPDVGYCPVTKKDFF